jgi:hypothetical protein
MTPAELVSLYGSWPCDPAAIPPLARVFEDLLDESELVAVVCDASELAARMDLPGAMRTLAACTASAAESALAGGLAAWDRVRDLLIAGQAVRDAEGS